MNNISTENKYYNEAKKIIQIVMNKYESPRQFYNSCFGTDLITKHEILDTFYNYAYIIGLRTNTTFQFKFDKIKPLIKYENNSDINLFIINENIINNTIFNSKKAIIALCNRELGTYFIKSFNNKNQPWYKNKKQYKLSKNKKLLLQIKRGLGVINMYTVIDKPYLFKYALSYYTACLCDTFLKKDLIKHIEQFTINKYHAKKLVTNVLYDKNTIKFAFEGCVEILRNLNKINFDNLYAGEITLKDTFKIDKIVNTTNIVYPPFYNIGKNEYIIKLKEIKKLNML